jgi:2,3-bisphosphoglycerate-dependent phosphoglycerate mutase
MQLYMIRHGESHVNVSHWDTLATMDTELTDKGHRQAAALRDWLKTTDIKADALYASTMRRAVQTASYVAEALDIEVTPDDRLREIGNSYITGHPIEEERLPRTFIDHWPHVAPFAHRSTEFEGIESWMHFRIRLAQFVDGLALRHIHQKVFVVAHGGVIAAMFDNVFNVGPYRRCDINNHNTSITLFEHRIKPEREPWSLWYHNRVDHLAGTGLI